jgi:hypothetical protein
MNELIGAACLLVGGWCMWKSMRALVRGVMSRSWPVAAGVILTTKLVKKRNSEGDEVSHQDLEYSYSVHGRTYRKTRVRFGIPRSMMYSNSQHGYRRGEHVDVYYSPARPSVSALQRGSSPFALITLGGGGFLVWIGFRLLVAQ